MADKRVYLSGTLKHKRKEEKKEKEELANKTSQHFNLFHLGSARLAKQLVFDVNRKRTHERN